MDALEFAERFGLPTAMLALVSIAAWRVLRYLGRKLFDENGIVPKVVNSHLRFVDAVEQSVLRQEKHARESSEAYRQHAERTTEAIEELRDAMCDRRQRA